MKALCFLFLLLIVTPKLEAQIDSEIFEFKFKEITLNGLLNNPANHPPKGIVLIIHGSGQTNAVEQGWHYDVREQFVKSGYAVYMWDKMGCGKSGGVFDYNQPVQNSADEVIAAINALKKAGVPGADYIGLWGISRAGWINPLVINQYPGIKFWVSVSGVDDKENFGYLLSENLRISGLSQDSVRLIVGEWYTGNKISHRGGSFEEFQQATQNLRANEFSRRFNNNREISEEEYYGYQRKFMRQDFDESTGLPVYISHFDSILLQVSCPVLALFGETDRNVDWRKTKNLYEQTLGQNTVLTVKSFPGCNHNLFKCKTGGFYEFADEGLEWERCNGFLEAIGDWLGRIKN